MRRCEGFVSGETTDFFSADLLLMCRTVCLGLVHLSVHTLYLVSLHFRLRQAMRATVTERRKLARKAEGKIPWLEPYLAIFRK